MSDEDRPQFSVYRFFSDGTSEPISRFVKADVAKATAQKLIASAAAQHGYVTRVMITDGGDFCCFEWEYGKGVVFPEGKEQ